MFVPSVFERKSMGTIISLVILSAVKISLKISSHAFPHTDMIRFRQMCTSEGNGPWRRGEEKGGI